MSLINNAKFYITPISGELYNITVSGNSLKIVNASSTNIVGDFIIDAVYVENTLLKINSTNGYFEFNNINLSNINGTPFVSINDALDIINFEIVELSVRRKLIIKNEVLTNKYTVTLLQDGSATGVYFLSIKLDLGSGLVEVASVSYTDMLINGIEQHMTIISAPDFYAELTINNCNDHTYNFITNALI
jgi:hypothetical protein